MRPTLDEILSASLEALGYDRKYWKSVKNRRLPEAVKVKQFVAYLGHEIEGYPMTRIGAFLGLSHATISGHYHNARFFLQHEPDYREAMDNALEIIDRLKGAQKHVTIRGWVARDGECECDNIYVYSEAPRRSKESNAWLVPHPLCHFWKLPKDSFAHITWESEPQEAEITIKLKYHESTRE